MPVKTKKPAATKRKSGFIKKHVVAIGSGVAALGAATYYLFGPKGKKHQKDIKDWMVHMKKDVSKQWAKTEKATETAYHKIVDDASKAYAKHGKVEVAAYSAKLKKQWRSVAKPVAKTAQSAVKKVEKTVKTIKKSVKKK